MSGKEAVSREYTINLHKRLHGVTFKRRAPRAVDEIRKFARKMMKTKEVRLDAKLNQAVWSQGIRNVPKRLRIVVSRKHNSDEDAQEKFVCHVTVADKQSFAGLGTTVVDTQED
ncbi:unnamed protein product [Pedinophyceae sp. YPF-701]|nr:unnamed protein product [Pedinophyceae sp. YPF-701]